MDGVRTFQSKDGYIVHVVGETHNCYYLYCEEEGAMMSAPKYRVSETYLRVCNVGFIDCNKVSEFKEIKKSAAYKVWHGILLRIGKGNYENVQLSSEWHYFSFFKKFHDVNYQEGFVIDKDLRSGRYDKMYSARTCSYIPKSLNTAIYERSKDFKPFEIDSTGCYYFTYSSTYGYDQRPHIIRDKTIEGICEKYALYRCTRVLSIYNEYWRQLNDDVRKAICTLYDFKNYYERIYSLCIHDPYVVMHQLDDGLLW
uniref:hypothetical protein n=1 Tax=Prevotella sp. TaxID=59823 RepID=UPI0025E42AF4